MGTCMVNVELIDQLTHAESSWEDIWQMLSSIQVMCLEARIVMGFGGYAYMGEG